MILIIPTIVSSFLSNYLIVSYTNRGVLCQEKTKPEDSRFPRAETALIENKVIVNIFGEEYPITAMSDPAYVSRIADFVDSRMKELAKRSRTKAKERVAILAAMSIASELFEKNEDISSFEEDFTSRLDSVMARLDETLANVPAD
jgi:cell division protein ZapA